MPKLTRRWFVLPVGIVVLIHELWLFSILPGGSNSDQVSGVPFALLVPLAIPVALYLVLGWITNKQAASLLTVACMAAVVSTQLVVNSPGHDRIVRPVDEAVGILKAVWKYPEHITYYDLLLNTGPERVAALLKYGDSLPERAVAIETYEGNTLTGRYAMAYVNEKWVSDNAGLRVKDNGDTATLVANPTDPLKRREYTFAKADLTTGAQRSGNNPLKDEYQGERLLFWGDYSKTMDAGWEKLVQFILAIRF